MFNFFFNIFDNFEGKTGLFVIFIFHKKKGLKSPSLANEKLRMCVNR